jgi:uncharacterized protein (TIGR02594 family)
MKMLRMVAFCRPVAALALCTAAIAASISPASARPHHGASRAYHRIAHHARWHHVRYYSSHSYRHVILQSRWERGAVPMGEDGFGFNSGFTGMTSDAGNTARTTRYQSRHQYRRIARQSLVERSVAESHASARPGTAGASAIAASSGSSLVSEARRYLGGNPTGRGSLWCARFMNMVLQHTGHSGTGSDMANSFAHYGTRVSGPQVGAIAVMSRGRGGGHVGIITGVDSSGNPIMISGNNGNRVREAPVSRGRIYAYVMPN